MSMQSWMLSFIIFIVSSALCFVHGVPMTILDFGKFLVTVGFLTLFILGTFVISLKFSGLPVPPIFPTRKK